MYRKLSIVDSVCDVSLNNWSQRQHKAQQCTVAFHLTTYSQSVNAVSGNHWTEWRKLFAEKDRCVCHLAAWQCQSSYVQSDKWVASPIRLRWFTSSTELVLQIITSLGNSNIYLESIFIQMTLLQVGPRSLMTRSSRRKSFVIMHRWDKCIIIAGDYVEK